MSLDEAITEIQAMIAAVSGGAQVKVVIISEEEARITVFAPAADLQIIKDETFMPTMRFLNDDDLDIQVQVYDQDAPPLSV